MVPPEPPALCLNVHTYALCLSHKPLLVSAYHPSEPSGCFGRWSEFVTETEVTPNPMVTKNILQKVNPRWIIVKELEKEDLNTQVQMCQIATFILSGKSVQNDAVKKILFNLIVQQEKNF